jgi:DNA-directed RNA polymerase specialized sigma24 family protein
LYAISLQGYTMSEIAFIFGMPKSTVHKYIKTRPPGWTPKWRKIE